MLLEDMEGFGGGPAWSCTLEVGNPAGREDNLAVTLNDYIFFGSRKGCCFAFRQPDKPKKKSFIIISFNTIIKYLYNLKYHHYYNSLPW